jgi:myo-inositol-1(or 4)-monophosphatase
MSLSSTAAYALDVAREAAGLVMRILPESQASKDIQFKTPTDSVTRADREAEQLIAARIHARFPDHGLVGEEGTDTAGTGSGGRGQGTGGPRWIIDPVDGTSNFAHGIPWFAISIALEDRGALQCGVVAALPLGEYFLADRGRGAFLVERDGALTRLRPSTTHEIGSAIVATGLPGHRYRGRHVSTISPVMMRALTVRLMGSAAIHLAFIAAGRIEAFWEPGLSAWDVAAGVLLVEEAGGRVTDWSGAPLRSLEDPLLASNGPLHPTMLELLRPEATREGPSGRSARPRRTRR